MAVIRASVLELQVIGDPDKKRDRQENQQRNNSRKFSKMGGHELADWKGHWVPAQLINVGQ